MAAVYRVGILVTILVLEVYEVTTQCNRDTGPAGITECFLGTPWYSEHQCGTCLTNAYIIQKSSGRHICRNNATYCYYQCMIETHNVAEGPVYDDCSCQENDVLPQPSVILPADCYSPDGTDCGWYSRCLAARYPCTGQAEYAVSFGNKFCNLYAETTLPFADSTLVWIDAVRKCLQVELVPLLRLCRQPPTCEEIRSTAFASHEPCYLHPYRGFSVCHISPADWMRVFWTIKASFARVFIGTLKTLLSTAWNHCGDDYTRALSQLMYVLNVRRPRTVWNNQLVVKRSVVESSSSENTTMTDDELAHAIMLSISSTLGWDEDTTVDWYAFATNSTRQDDVTEKTGDIVQVQVFLVDRLSIGLMTAAESVGLRRLNETVQQLTEAIANGLDIKIANTSLDLHVTSLRHCDAHHAADACQNGTVVIAQPQRTDVTSLRTNAVISNSAKELVVASKILSLLVCLVGLVYAALR